MMRRRSFSGRLGKGHRCRNVAQTPAGAPVDRPRRHRPIVCGWSGVLCTKISACSKKHSLDVQLQTFNNGATIAAASRRRLAGRRFFRRDRSSGTAHLRGLPFAVIAPGFSIRRRLPGYAIVVKGDGPIKAAKDFNGKTIGINAVKSISQLVVQAWVDGNGGDSKTLKFAELPFATMVASVANGTVDACTPGEPFVTGALESGMRSFLLEKNGLINYMPAGCFSDTRGSLRTPMPRRASRKRFARHRPLQINGHPRRKRLRFSRNIRTYP